jgi:hypothetical protein
MPKSLTLQELFNCAAENAKSIFEQSGEVHPMWHVVDGDNQNILIATPWSSDEEKEAITFSLRLLFRQQRVKRLAFIVEAWIVSARTERISSPPSKHPDRREVVMITAEDRDGSSLHGMYYVLRPEHGPAKLSPLKMQDYDKTTGRMVGMLT